MASTSVIDPHQLECLEALQSKVRWLASWMIHNANHLRDSGEERKKN